jgi:hypothetical protein
MSEIISQLILKINENTGQRHNNFLQTKEISERFLENIKQELASLIHSGFESCYGHFCYFKNKRDGIDDMVLHFIRIISRRQNIFLNSKERHIQYGTHLFEV